MNDRIGDRPEIKTIGEALYHIKRLALDKRDHLLWEDSCKWAALRLRECARLAITAGTLYKKELSTLRAQLAEAEKKIEGMRKQIEGVNVTAALKGIPITVNKYLPKRTIIVSPDFVGEEQEKFFDFPIEP